MNKIILVISITTLSFSIAIHSDNKKLLRKEVETPKSFSSVEKALSINTDSIAKAVYFDKDYDIAVVNAYAEKLGYTYDNSQLVKINKKDLQN